MRINRPRLLTSSAVVVCLVTTLLAARAQNRPASLPAGNWTFSAGVYTGPDHAADPVDVYSVLTDAGKGLAVVGVGLHNRTAKDIASVKLRWLLRNTDDGAVVAEGGTSFVGVFVPAGGRQVLDYPVASFSKIAASKLKTSTLSGNFRLEVRAGEVRYADEVSGSTR